MNPFKKMKLKSKLRHCDYKLAGTVIKQQYYNDSSYTEINRMIDHFMEEPCFERALDLIEYNEMIVFYFTESCTDGLYVRKAPIEPTKSIAQLDSNTYEEDHTFAESPSTKKSNEPPKEQSIHSEHLQKIQESEEWMDEMISRLARKPKQPKQPTEAAITPTPAPPSVKVYTEAEVETFDTIEFKSPDSFREMDMLTEIRFSTGAEKKDQVVFYETAPVDEPMDEPVDETSEAKPAKVIEVFYETEVYQEKHDIAVFYEVDDDNDIEISHETIEVQKKISNPEANSSDIHTEQEAESTAAFKFVASAGSSHWEIAEPSEASEAYPLPERMRAKRPSFPNVVATLKIDLHTMMKQLDEYRYQLAYHPHNEQQMIGWIEALEKAVDEFSAAIDLIEDTYE